MYSEKYFHFFSIIFNIFVWRARMCWPLHSLCRPFCIFERCLHSNPDTCSGSKAVTSDQSPALSLWYTDWERKRYSSPLWKDEKFSQTITMIHLILYCSSAVYPILKGTVSRDFRLWFFSWISFPQAPQYTILTVLNFFENSRRYSRLKVHHWCRWHHWQMEKIINHKSLNYLVWTSLGSSLNL
jgi:hypothetical protein